MNYNKSLAPKVLLAAESATRTHGSKSAHINNQVGLATAVAKLLIPEGYLGAWRVGGLLKIFSQEGIDVQRYACRKSPDKDLKKAYARVSDRLVKHDSNFDKEELMLFLEELFESLEKENYYPHVHLGD